MHFTDEVLARLGTHRQLTSSAPEGGGQLFARFQQLDIHIEAATEPTPRDLRTRVSFVPNRWIEKRDIRRMHAAGLHYVGDWHTHPEPLPSPSQTDVVSMTDMFRTSRHNLAGFLMVIVGTVATPGGFFVGIVDRRGVHRLTPHSPRSNDL